MTEQLKLFQCAESEESKIWKELSPMCRREVEEVFKELVIKIIYPGEDDEKE